MRCFPLAAVVTLLLAPAAGSVYAEPTPPRFTLELELGPVWQSRNDVQIPNDSEGTRFALDELTGSGPYPAGRVTLTWDLRGRHGLRFVLAPLTITGDGPLPGPVRFAGETFAPGVPTDATYRFNSWRVTYRYHLRRRGRWQWWIGGTAKVRDARVALDQPGRSAEDTDVGVVPLFHLDGERQLAPRWRFVLDLDALAGGPGRAEDLALKLRRDLGERWSIAGGYRTLEGGADSDEVFAFAWLHYAVVSVEYRF